jgi:hypothetical protein
MKTISCPTMGRMNKNPLNKGVLMENGVGIGTVTPEMVEERCHHRGHS